MFEISPNSTVIRMWPKYDGTVTQIELLLSTFPSCDVEKWVTITSLWCRYAPFSSAGLRGEATGMDSGDIGLSCINISFKNYIISKKKSIRSSFASKLIIILCNIARTNSFLKCLSFILISFWGSKASNICSSIFTLICQRQKEEKDHSLCLSIPTKQLQCSFSKKLNRASTFRLSRTILFKLRTIGNRFCILWSHE